MIYIISSLKHMGSPLTRPHIACMYYDTILEAMWFNVLWVPTNIVQRVQPNPYTLKTQR